MSRKVEKIQQRKVKTVAIVQARMGSTRLPGKVLMKIKGKTLLHHLIQRISKAKTLDTIVVATTTLPEDLAVVEETLKIAGELKLDNLFWFLGSEEDVLLRYLKAAERFGADIIVRVTADNPFTAPEEIDKMVNIMQREKVDIVHNKDVLDETKKTVPIGIGAEVLSIRTLRKLDALSEGKRYREHVVFYIFDYPKRFNIRVLENPALCRPYRLTVDTKDDLSLVKEIFNRLYKKGRIFSLKEIITLMDKNPDLPKINSYIEDVWRVKGKNILVFPGGTEIGLEIWKSLKDCKYTTLYSAGSEVSDHASYVFKNHFIVPDVHTNNWLGVLNKIINKYHIDYIYPAHDDVLLALAQNADKLNAGIITSPLSTCLITRSKTKTYKKLKNLIPVPNVFNKISEIKKFPVFVKPEKGQGSQDARRVDNMDTLKALLKDNSDLIVLEYLSGKEYTVDCFTDRRKGLFFCNGRERIRVSRGISMNSKPVGEKTNKIFCKYANIISQKLQFHGPWFFQMKADSSGTFKLLEIAPRISGTMATYRALGVNFPLLGIYEREGVDIKIIANKFDVEIDRSLINRYRYNIKYTKVYVDLDDTLIMNGKVNTQLIRFLYQALNENCKIILISKSVENVKSVLRKWRMDGLFDEVICLKKDDSKAEHIDPKGAIFIDDSFSERESIFEKHKIPTFDCSMIELLIDERV